jgi:3'-phosphoadenosine 5'-phosphosulfate sulfotransferase
LGFEVVFGVVRVVRVDVQALEVSRERTVCGWPCFISSVGGGDSHLS